MQNVLSMSELQASWINRNDLDRAADVHAIHRSGTSIRQIASQLHKKESSLRRLLRMLDAPAVDRLLFRQGKITGNELVRRAKTDGLKRAARHQEELKLKRERQTLKAPIAFRNGSSKSG